MTGDEAMVHLECHGPYWRAQAASMRTARADRPVSTILAKSQDFSEWVEAMNMARAPRA